MRINTNVSSMTAQAANVQNNNNLSSSLEKLSTGLAINKASDNAAGLAIADKLRTQTSSIGQAIKNGNSAVAMLQITDQAMSEQSNILDTIKTKLVQASTATTSTDGVKALNEDVQKLLKQLDNIAKDTNYNGIALLQASSSSSAVATSKAFQMGEYASSTITLQASIQANTAGLGIAASSMSFTTNTAAQNLLTKVDKALTSLNKMRSRVGSIQNQVESSMRNLQVTEVNIKAAESIIRDVDYAKESANFNKMNIIAQAGTYAISQANTAAQNVSRLLQ
jgi:flagellin